jgi:hypothetical protein
LEAKGFALLFLFVFPYAKVQNIWLQSHSCLC